jgi:hypothetical protein
MLFPLTASRWDLEAAAHLLVRAAFGEPPKKCRRPSRWDRKKAVESLISAPLEKDLTPAWARPDDQDELRAQIQEATAPEENT